MRMIWSWQSGRWRRRQRHIRRRIKSPFLPLFLPGRRNSFPEALQVEGIRFFVIQNDPDNVRGQAVHAHGAGNHGSIHPHLFGQLPNGDGAIFFHRCALARALTMGSPEGRSVFFRAASCSVRYPTGIPPARRDYGALVPIPEAFARLRLTCWKILLGKVSCAPESLLRLGVSERCTVCPCPL